MPFGMVSSGASFVRLMKMFLEGKEKLSDSFKDDIMIVSDSWLAYFQHVNVS